MKLTDLKTNQCKFLLSQNRAGAMNKMFTYVEKYAFTQTKKESSKKWQQTNVNKVAQIFVLSWKSLDQQCA